MLPLELEDEDTLQNWLGRRARELSVEEDAGAMKPPKLVHPKIGEKAKLMEMVHTNAKFLLGEIKLQKMKEADHIPHVLKAIERDLHLKRPHAASNASIIPICRGANMSARWSSLSMANRKNPNIENIKSGMSKGTTILPRCVK